MFTFRLEYGSNPILLVSIGVLLLSSAASGVNLHVVTTMKAKFYIPFLAVSLLTASTDAAWQRLGGSDKRPVDLASSSISDVSVSSSNGIGQPENLISDDVSASSLVGAGSSEAVFNLGRQTNIHLAGISNDGAEGRLAIAGSVDQKTWTNLGQSVFTPADRLVNVKFASAQVKYVKLQFDLSKGGNIRSLELFGTETGDDFVLEDGAPSDTSSADAGGGLGGTRIIYIHPDTKGPDELATKYNRFDFPESDEPFRTIIYDLGSERVISELGSVHSARPVRFYAYTFKDKQLPEKEDWRGRMSFDATVFDTRKPDLVVEDNQGRGYLTAKLSKPVSARYVAMRWEPDFNPPSFSVSGPKIKVKSKGKAKPKNNVAGGGAGGGAGEGGSGTDASSGNNTGDAAQPAVTNPFAFTSAGFGGGGGTGGVNQPNNNNNNQTASRPRPRPRPRSP